jgi:hypothetical protein
MSKIATVIQSLKEIELNTYKEELYHLQKRGTGSQRCL